MDFILITRPDFFPKETQLVNQLFAQGLTRLHLRKPTATADELNRWLQQIDRSYLPHIALHDHHHLVNQWNLGGVHLNARNPQAPIGWGGESEVLLSRSCHSLDEVRCHAPHCDYVFLSPIFDSISKHGYASPFRLENLAEVHAELHLSDKVYALGGITPDRLPAVQQVGFRGVAVLGDIWQHPHPLERLQEYLQFSL